MAKGEAHDRVALTPEILSHPARRGILHGPDSFGSGMGQTERPERVRRHVGNRLVVHLDPAVEPAQVFLSQEPTQLGERRHAGRHISRKRRADECSGFVRREEATVVLQHDEVVER